MIFIYLVTKVALLILPIFYYIILQQTRLCVLYNVYYITEGFTKLGGKTIYVFTIIITIDARDWVILDISDKLWNIFCN